MTDLEKIDEFLENYKKVSPKKYYSEAQINEMFVKDFMDYRRSIMMNEKLSARQKAMILAGMIGAGGLTGGLTSCAQPNTEDNTPVAVDELTGVGFSYSEKIIYKKSGDSVSKTDIKSCLNVYANFSISGAHSLGNDYDITYTESGNTISGTISYTYDGVTKTCDTKFSLTIQETITMTIKNDTGIDEIAYTDGDNNGKLAKGENTNIRLNVGSTVTFSYSLSDEYGSGTYKCTKDISSINNGESLTLEKADFK